MQSLRKPRNLIIIAFVVLALGVLAASWFNTASNVIPRERVTVVCNIGSEKDDFLENEEVQRILLNDYGLEVDFDTMGSIEQVLLPEGQLRELDCLWPSNSSASEIFAIEHPTISHDSEVIFNSPIVLYSWADVVDGMLGVGIVEQQADGHYIADMARLTLELQQPRPQWSNVGVDRPGTFRIETTDPTRSNSGNMFYGLFLNMLAGGDIATMDALDEHFGEIENYYNAQGFMEGSSGDLFDKYVTIGSGQYPLIANYESLIIELSVANPDAINAIQDQIRIIYPQPTVYSAHPLIALTDNGERLMDALKDERIQTIAWEQHGFRSAVPTITNDPAVLNVANIPAQLTQILNLPRPEAMLDMVERLES